MPTNTKMKCNSYAKSFDLFWEDIAENLMLFTISLSCFTPNSSRESLFTSTFETYLKEENKFQLVSGINK